jgi:hypothetical protein
MKRKFLLCVDNEGYEASLEIRKLYEKLPDKEAERHNQVRIIDESGEDYLYPSEFLRPSASRCKQETESPKRQPDNPTNACGNSLRGSL